MRHRKRHSNAEATKLLDKEEGHRHTAKEHHDMAVCPRCSAVLLDRRWTRAEAAYEAIRSMRRLPHQRVCPACRKAHARHPEGIVDIQGGFVAEHIDEIERVLTSEAECAASEHPLARIISIAHGDGTRLVVTTTTGHLAHRLGHALQTSLGGAIEAASSPEDHPTRVTWTHN